MKSILVVTSDFEASGITSFMIALANYLSKNNMVTVAYQSDGEKKNELNSQIKTIKYDVPSRINLALILFFKGKIRYYLDLKKSKRTDIAPIASTQVINYIKAEKSSSIKEKYDIVISTAEFFCNYYVAMKTVADKKIAWVHPDYSKLNVNKQIETKVFHKFNKIVTISESCYKSFIQIFPEFIDKVCMIENIIDRKKIIELSKEHIPFLNENYLKLVTVCRIDNTSKRLDRIIEAARQMKLKKMKFIWYIVGGGNDENYIASLIEEYNLKEHVIMVGNQKNPYPFIKKADVFVLSSQYEGKPIVVTEAIILKCPVIVTNYLSAREQVKSYNGIIIENSDKTFSKELINAIQNDLKKIHISENMDNNDKSQAEIDKLIK